MTTRVLFVCLGNICRSPSAEGVFRTLAAEAGLEVVTDSAGTSDWHVGEAPYAPMQAAAKARGVDLSDLRARQFTSRDFETFDLIIGMDDSNLDNIERLRPKGSQTPVQIFTDFAPEVGVDHVPDPYYTRDFDQTLDLVQAASLGLIAQLS
ncbi:low molecular weight protein-tyrosine-phosphatase [Aliiroseovarius sp. S1123]|uniref:low molecular weight protein-tyrosine-phosphatase n=1 Tax=unclassified Aliiroseovarius TaxID=2623558 RepID=UPI001FF19845|nr:low molecular weight protein-tyrosine-phosphatase [Aliiroseovarius sp. S1123]MCK0171185.1 low molecular weight phosphotyrosine protein phosphatase [Aliiroseovarius sp. S1123]